VSFKTNVNRAKTKKWVQAKKNAYDGDDWGDYDEYDEYGAYGADQEPAPSQPAPAQQHQQQRYYASGPPQPQRTHTDRSFTEPYQQGPAESARRNSFEAGEENRVFSASMAQSSQQQHQHQQQGYGQQPYGQAQRDFAPPPLHTQVSPMPSDIGASPVRTQQFPPRKSSIGQTESPIAPMSTSPRPRTGSSDKPLPFVRPADIYKRMEEEKQRERASLESSRPSLDSLSSRPKDDLNSPTSDGGRLLQPLETVTERKGEYLPDFDSAFVQDGEQPAVGGPQAQAPAPAGHVPAVLPQTQADLGFRSVVDQAFTRTDDTRSIPPTPVSKDDDSSMSRTNTGSTTGISPIMSRVPSAATSAIKRNHAAGDGSTPAIAEEPSDTPTPVPQPTSNQAHDAAPPHAPRPFADHTRNLSNTSLPRSGLATPTRGDSPARSPQIAPHKDMPGPRAALIATGSPDEPQAMEGGLSGPSPAYATREADIATALQTSPTSAGPALGAAELQSQDTFLESHKSQSPIDDVHPRSRSESPSKGRVQTLAGKFGDVSNSRRGSTQSNLSRNSVQSWERSKPNSRAASPTKGSPGKPSSPVKEKEFRPHLPGQWESYATTAMTPSDAAEKDRGLGFGQGTVLGARDEPELTPTTAKRSVAEAPAEIVEDPLSALKSAGAAMAESFRTTVGLDSESSEPHTKQDDHPKGLSYGNMYKPRPLQLERAESAMSSMPPTPPAKDTPTTEHAPQLSPTEASTRTPTQPKRPDLFPQLSTDTSADDQESDRLRKEIVASLTPVTSVNPLRTSLLPDSSPGANRASSILPAEYDSYWADGGGQASPRLSQHGERDLPTTSTAASVPSTTQHAPLQTSLLNRFSWEANNPQAPTSNAADRGVAVPDPPKTTSRDTVPPPTVERAAEEERQQWSEGLSEPYFGPAHTVTVTQPAQSTEAAPAPRTPTSSGENHMLSSPSQEQKRSPGLHVVNSTVDPEAVDLPPRLSADHPSPTDAEHSDLKSLPQELNKDLPNPAVSTTFSAPGPSAPHHEPSATSPTSGKPLGGREIATITSTAERIATYNQTREHWAKHDHGLKGWLESTLEANPNLTLQTGPAQHTATGPVRHKHTPSLSLLSKFGGSNTHQSQGTEQQQQPPFSQDPVGEGSPGAADRRAGSRQLETKGKDLLHSANVLSGKGLTSAKSLFNKSKSRFGREKVEK